MLSMPLSQHVVHKYENTVVDYIIGGDISLRAAGGQQFYKLVEPLTNSCYKPLSTRTILRRTVELFNIAQPSLEKFLCSLDTCISLTMDGWSNRNLKGCYVVTAHLINTTSGTMKSLLLTMLDVSSGSGIGNRVGSALFAYLTDKVGIAVLSHLLHVVTDNGSDACAAVTRLFQLGNSHLGSNVLLPSNHICCADHSEQRGVISILSQVKGIYEELWGSLVSIRRSKLLRQSYRSEGQRLGYNSKEPPHYRQTVSPTIWSCYVHFGRPTTTGFNFDRIWNNFDSDPFLLYQLIWFTYIYCVDRKLNTSPKLEHWATTIVQPYLAAHSPQNIFIDTNQTSWSTIEKT